MWEGRCRWCELGKLGVGQIVLGGLQDSPSYQVDEHCHRGFQFPWWTGNPAICSPPKTALATPVSTLNCTLNRKKGRGREERAKEHKKYYSRQKMMQEQTGRPLESTCGNHHGADKPIRQCGSNCRETFGLEKKYRWLSEPGHWMNVWCRSICQSMQLAGLMLLFS